MAQMNTDAAVLSKEAGSFERIAGELKSVIAHVESTAGSLSGQWHGQAGVAAQAATVPRGRSPTGSSAQRHFQPHPHCWFPVHVH